MLLASEVQNNTTPLPKASLPLVANLGYMCCSVLFVTIESSKDSRPILVTHLAVSTKLSEQRESHSFVQGSLVLLDTLKSGCCSEIIGVQAEQELRGGGTTGKKAGTRRNCSGSPGSQHHPSASVYVPTWPTFPTTVSLSLPMTLFPHNFDLPGPLLATVLSEIHSAWNFTSSFC